MLRICDRLAAKRALAFIALAAILFALPLTAPASPMESAIDDVTDADGFIVRSILGMDILLRPVKESPPFESPALAEYLADQGAIDPSFQSILKRYDIQFAGWLEQGFTVNPQSPADRSNLPVIFNDRANDYQLNQFWIHLGRRVDTERRDFDVGGRVDLTYGTDSHFTTSHGLETRWNSSDSPMQLAMPQLYAEVALRRFSMIAGHYLTPIGYEYTPATPNFFYSHSYSFNFEPGTFTGTLATFHASDRFQLSAGFQRGPQTWIAEYEDNNRLGVVAAAQWTSRDKRASAQFALSGNRLGPAGAYRNNTYALVLQYRLSRRLHYVFEQAGWQQVDRTASTAVDFQYGTTQYLFYTINDRWKAGARVSWNGYYEMQTYAADDSRDVTNYNIYSATLGLNWKPCRNVVLRPEIRIDWSDSPQFDDDSAYNQLLIAVDSIFRF